MAYAEKLPSGSWRVQASRVLNGKRQRRSFTVSPEECGGDSRRAKAKAELMASEWIAALKEELPCNITVKKAMLSYIEDRSRILSPSSQREYTRNVGYFERIHDVRVEDVTSQDIQRIINHMAGTVKAKTIRDRVSFLLTCLDAAGSEKRFRLSYPVSVPREQTAPDHRQVLTLISEADAVMKPIICLAAFYSLRRGEICALKFSDVSYDLHSVSVHANMVKGPDGFVYKDIPKTSGSIRTVYPIPDVMDLLPSGGSPDEFLFPFTPDALERRFKRLKDKLGIDVRFHDLRHYAASFRSDLNIPRKYIEEVGGWEKDSKVLTSVYDNTLNSSRKKFTQVANDWISDTYGEALKIAK